MNFIAYYRVSTIRQGQSGLGLESQRSAVKACITSESGVLLNEFQEIESGKNNRRPILAEALEACKKNKATLIVAKLDRLSRDVGFIASLRSSGVEFKAADFPQANSFMVNILAAVAQYERELIAKRTKDALAARKARGLKCGNPQNLTGGLLGNKAAHAKAVASDFRIEPLIFMLAQRGMRNHAIATELNLRKVPTERNGRWHQESIRRVRIRLERAGKVESAA